MFYFASDTHLGLHSEGEEGTRERAFTAWLDSVAADAEAVFLAGDIFDFWFEYKRVVPKGFVRLLGKLAEMVDRGIEVHFFPGNHDMWVGEYFRREIGMIVHDAPELMELYGKRVFTGHGDGMDAGRGTATKLRDMFFRSRAARRFFSRVVHPDAFLRFGHRWSSGNRRSKGIKELFHGEEEGLVRFAREYLAAGHGIDYFVFGHIHIAEEYDLGGGIRMFFLGEWFEDPHYAALSPDGTMKLVKYTHKNS